VLVSLLLKGIGKNSTEVRSVLETFVELGAPPAILVQGKPHLGTDRMVHLLRQAHSKLVALGVEVRYNTKVTSLVAKGPGGRVSGVVLRSSDGNAATAVDEGVYALEDCEAVLLAVGHSARDLYETLHAQGDVALSFQPFSAGLRAEHPQALINELQYGPKLAELAGWKQPLPAADYKLVASGLRTRYSSTRDFSHASSLLPRDRTRGRGEGKGESEDDESGEAAQFTKGPTAAYSFCMCPGGQVVPTAMEPDYLCVNGMSYSKRSSPFANSGLVVPISLADCLPFVSGAPSASFSGDDGLDPTSSAAVLAGLAFQRAVERSASLMGGGNLVAPVQSIGDFLAEKPLTSSATSAEAPLSSSYRLGVKRAPLQDLYPPQVKAVLLLYIYIYFPFKRCHFQ